MGQSADSYRVYPEVTGYPTDIYGKGPKYEIGPLGLAFFDANTLVTGDGGFIDSKELIRFFKVGKGPQPHAAEL